MGNKFVCNLLFISVYLGLTAVDINYQWRETSKIFFIFATITAAEMKPKQKKQLLRSPSNVDLHSCTLSYAGHLRLFIVQPLASGASYGGFLQRQSLDCVVIISNTSKSLVIFIIQLMD